MHKKAYRMFDYTNENRRWGHDFMFVRVINEDTHNLEIMGFGLHIEKGDAVLLGTRLDDMGVHAYAVEDISYYKDPADMWLATLKFVPGGDVDAENSTFVQN